MNSRSRTLSVDSVALPRLQGRIALEPVRLSGREGVNGLFEYELILKAPEDPDLSVNDAADINLDDFIGREISCSIQLDGSGTFRAGVVGTADSGIGAGERQINALITAATFWGEEGRHLQYKLQLRPWLHLATLSADCKIFQNKNVVEILDALLAGYPFPVEKRLYDQYPLRDFQVQYNESDFDFFARLSAEWGISFHFEHGDGKHRLVLSDAMASFPPHESAAYRELDYHAPGWKTDAEYVHSFVPHHQITSGRFATNDYDYTRPRANLTQARSDQRETGQNDGEVYQWHHGTAGAHYAQPRAGLHANDPQAEGGHLATLRMQALRTHGARARASGNLRAMVPGCTFKLHKHPRQSVNAEYLVLDTQFLIEDIGQDSQVPDAARDRRQQWRVEVDFTAHPVTEPLRPALTHKKPHTHGPHTAVVVGPEGQNLWTDELGRIKVQFPWDRDGQMNQHSSCWVRVSNAWAGNQLGAMHVPRIGQEVIIEFIGGDPDQPFCAGRAFNQLNLPPWQLPAQAALSGFRSRELTELGGNSAAGRSNHLLMDDTPGQIQAQLKSDHQHSQLSLGRITRVEDHQGRKDARGEGFELHTEGQGVLRANGMLISTESRPRARAHHKDLGETVERLAIAGDQQQTLGQLAQEHGAQESQDQTDVADVIRSQNDDIRGDGPADAATGRFPELSASHLVLASPAGIEATTARSTHLASGEHLALTSGGHTSLAIGQRLLASVSRGVRVFIQSMGWRLVAATGDIDVRALRDSINLLAKLNVTVLGNRITIQAREELVISGGGSATTYNAGGIHHRTGGHYTVHASHYNLSTAQRHSAAFPDSPQSGNGNLELFHRYANRLGIAAGDFRVEDALGKVVTGKLDRDGFAAVNGMAPGPAKVTFGKDPADTWSTAAYVGRSSWPQAIDDAQAPATDAVAVLAQAMDIAGLLGQNIRVSPARDLLALGSVAYAGRDLNALPVN